MEQSHGSVSNPLSLDQLVSSALRQLAQRGSRRRSRNRYRAIWKHLTELARQHPLGEAFSETLAARFVDAYQLRQGERTKPTEQGRQHIGVGLKVLGDWARQRRRAPPVADVHKIQLLPAMKKALCDDEQYGRERLYLQPSTLRRRLTALTVFVDFLSSRQTKTRAQMQAVDVAECVASRAHWKPRPVARIITDVRSFLRFLTLRGIVQKDRSGALPKGRVPRDAPMPSVWDPALIVKLLGVIERSAATGKRAYAMILLACRLGLRVGDSRALKLDDLHWPDATLTTRDRAHFSPRMLPLQERRQLLQAVEHLVPTARSPLRHLTMPEIFRLLYGCGLRLGEVLHLRVREVDLDHGILRVRQGKWRKDRLVPPAPSLGTR